MIESFLQDQKSVPARPYQSCQYFYMIGAGGAVPRARRAPEDGQRKGRHHAGAPQHELLGKCQTAHVPTSGTRMGFRGQFSLFFF